MAITETYNVLRIYGRKPNSPLKGFQFPDESNTQRDFSFMIGKAFRNRLTPITRRSRSEKKAMPSIICRADLSLIDLICFIDYSSFLVSVMILSSGNGIYPAS